MALMIHDARLSNRTENGNVIEYMENNKGQIILYQTPDGETRIEVYIELTALVVFAVQIAVSGWWLQRFRFGPLEWIWRMLTYGSYFKIRLEDRQ